MYCESLDRMRNSGERAIQYWNGVVPAPCISI